MISKRPICAVLVLLTFAISSGATGQSPIPCEDFGWGDGAFVSHLSQAVFVVRGGIVDTNDICTITMGSRTIQYEWPEQTRVPFTLSFSPGTRLVVFGLPGLTVAHTANTTELDAVYLMLAAPGACWAALGDLVVDGVSTLCNAFASGVDGCFTFGFANALLMDGFVMTGTIAFGYDAGYEACSRGFGILATNTLTVGSDVTTWGRVKSVYR